MKQKDIAKDHRLDAAISSQQYWAARNSGLLAEIDIPLMMEVFTVAVSRKGTGVVKAGASFGPSCTGSHWDYEDLGICILRNISPYR